MAAAVLVPPGPQRLEANLLAARLFATFGDPASLAIPDIVVLASGTPRNGRDGGFERAWDGIEGDFSCEKLEYIDGNLYLPVEGPLADLAAHAGSLFEEAGSLPFRPAIGFFLGAGGIPKEAACEIASSLTFRPFAWRACRLARLEFAGDLDGLASLHWRETASIWRPHRRKPRKNRDSTILER